MQQTTLIIVLVVFAIAFVAEVFHCVFQHKRTTVSLQHMDSLVNLAEGGVWERVINYCKHNSKVPFIVHLTALINTVQTERMALLQKARNELDMLSKKYYWPNKVLIALGLAYLIFALILVSIYHINQDELTKDYYQAFTTFNLAMAGCSVFIRWQTARWLECGSERLRRIFVALNIQGR